MEKILNNPKLNFYGGIGMVNKYIYMKREDSEKFLYFIYRIEKIENKSFPIKYECTKAYILSIYKDYKTTATVYDNIKIIELNNNDILYQISIEEYIAIFRAFVECQGTVCKKLPDPII